MTSDRPSDPGILTAEEPAPVRHPFRGARLLPGRAYHDPAIHEWERQNFLQADWVSVGRANEAPDPGTYFVAELDGESIVVVRGRDAELRAFYNVCRHRGTAVVEEYAGRHSRALGPVASGPRWIGRRRVRASRPMPASPTATVGRRHGQEPARRRSAPVE